MHIYIYILENFKTLSRCVKSINVCTVVCTAVMFVIFIFVSICVAFYYYGGSRTAGMSEMELFVIIVNRFHSLIV